MCGIIGSTNKDISIGLDSIAHRGPDSRDIKSVSGFNLGHVRLSIMDTSNESIQPYTVGDTTIVFNGCIFNYLDIKKYLSKKYNIVFKTNGDTEVLAHLLDKEDIEGLDYIQGMFAIGFVKNDTLTIVRDRHGETPIHYSLVDNALFPHLAFCSEIKGLKILGYENIQMLSPGSFIKYGSDNNVISGKWYDIRQHIKRNVFSDRPTASQKFKDLVQQGTMERTLSAVPVCSLNSGGIDSSVIAQALSQHNKNLVSYIAVYDEKSKDLRCARELAEMLNITLIEVKVDAPTTEDINELIYTIEMPYKAQIEISWACSVLAKRISSDGFKVILSGEGSDELLASYGMSYHGIKEHGFEEYRIRLFGSQERKNFPRCNKIFMKHGIECRLPFLNTELVETVLGFSQDIAWDTKRRPKAVLQDAYVNLLPEQIISRPKLAFQDGMKIKNEFVNVLDKSPRIVYHDVYKSIFGE